MHSGGATRITYYFRMLDIHIHIVSMKFIFINSIQFTWKGRVVNLRPPDRADPFRTPNLSIRSRDKRKCIRYTPAPSAYVRPALTHIRAHKNGSVYPGIMGKQFPVTLPWRRERVNRARGRVRFLLLIHIALHRTWISFVDVSFREVRPLSVLKGMRQKTKQKKHGRWSKKFIRIHRITGINIYEPLHWWCRAGSLHLSRDPRFPSPSACFSI